MANTWELGDLYNIVINWVAERQRDGLLTKDWMSVQSFDGDKLITLRNALRPIGGGPSLYVVVYDERNGPPRYEVHNWMNQQIGFVEIVGKCNAADPTFFEKLLNDMIGIQASEALRTLGEEHDRI